MSDWANYESEQQEKRRAVVVETIMTRFGIAKEDSLVVQAPAGNRVLKATHLIADIVKIAEETFA